MPEPNDGTLDLPALGSVPEAPPSQTGVATMDPTVGTVLNQGFANVAQNYAQAAARHNADAAQISTDAARLYLLTQQLVGAKAAGQLDRDALAFGILQARSAQGQPQLDSATVK